jgi:uncharacterized protein (DUF2236 family)
VSSFLASHLRYVNPALPGELQDRYYAETAQIAERLGAQAVPRSRAEVSAYLADMRPELEAGPRTLEVMRILLNAPVATPMLRPAATLVMHAGIDLLPPWAQRMLGVSTFAPLRRAVVRPGVRAVAPVLRWALVNGVSKRARRRASARSSDGDPRD